MSVNFFDSNCQEPPIDKPLFGICDNQNGERAYTDITDQNKWIATVENNNQVAIIFTAIDHCIEIRGENGDMDKRCDGMITYPDNIVFIELKDKEASWISDAINQLEVTINHFIANHDLNIYKHKRAFACNKRHPRFQVIDTALKQRFFSEYRVRLNIEATIKI